MMRLFVGVPPSDEARSVLARYMAAMKPSLPAEARWVPEENLHFTVLFIGNVPEQDVGAIARGLDRAVAPVRPFKLGLGEVGTFPGRGRARVLWVGALPGEAGLADVVSRVGEALRPWVEPEGRPFSAHLTLARFKPPARLSVGEVRDVDEPAAWTAEGVTLYLSRLKRPAPVYEPLHVARFKGP